MRTLFIDVINNNEIVIVPLKTEHVKSADRLLFWSAEDEQEGLLLVGNKCASLKMHSQLLEAFQRVEGEIGRRPSGAGILYKGEVYNWYSASYNVETPESLKPLISSILANPPT